MKRHLLLILALLLWVVPFCVEADTAPAHATKVPPLLADPRVSSLIDEAEALLERGQVEVAFPKLQALLAQTREIGDKVGEAHVLNDIGASYGFMGQPDKALAFYQQALAITQKIGDKFTEAGMQTNIGLHYAQTGQTQKALQTLQMALEMTRNVGDQKSEARVLGTLGYIYFDLNQYQRALSFFTQALAIQKKIADVRGQSFSLNNIAMIHRQRGNADQALDFFQQSLDIRTKSGDQIGQAQVLQNMALVYWDTRQPAKAHEFFQRALALARLTRNKRQQGTILANMASQSIISGQLEDGLTALNQALPIRQEVQDIQGTIVTLMDIAFTEEALHRWPAAKEHSRAAIEIIERQRNLIGNMTESKVSYLESQLRAYGLYISLLRGEKDEAEAFNWTQKVKARSLMDLMERGNVDLNKGITPSEKAQQTQLQRRVMQIHKELMTLAIASQADERQHRKLSEVEQQLAQGQNDLQQLNDSLASKYPDLATRNVSTTATLPDMGRLLPPDAALLEFAFLRLDHPMNPRKPLVLFCITQEKGQPVVKSYTVAENPARLMRQIEEFKWACSPEGGVVGGDYQALARQIYTQLIGPAAEQLAGKKHLLICPDGGLWGLPFQALVTGTSGNQPRFLIGDFEISYSYSASALQAIRHRRDRSTPRDIQSDIGPLSTTESSGVSSQSPPVSQIFRRPQSPGVNSALDKMLIVADPQFSAGISPLPGSKSEGAALKALFPNALLLSGSGAQEAVVKTRASDFRYLHFATHGAFNDAFPMMSNVVLAKPPQGSPEDGFLTAQEISTLTLHADMIVLSACDTAQGEQHGGEGIIGLAWALFIAGAPTQVLSQWPVEDQSTALFMKSFYSNLKGNKSKSEALRSAMLTLKKTPAYSHPASWAPFILIGEWRN